MKRSFAFFCACLRYIVRLYGNCRCTVQSSEKGCQEKGERVDQRGMEAIGKFFYTGVCFFQVPHVSGGRSGKPAFRAGRYCHRQECKNRQRECHNERHYQLCFQSQSTGCRQDERVDVFRGVFLLRKRRLTSSARLMNRVSIQRLPVL